MTDLTDHLNALADANDRNAAHTWNDDRREFYNENANALRAAAARIEQQDNELARLNGQTFAIVHSDTGATGAERRVDLLVAVIADQRRQIEQQDAVIAKVRALRSDVNALPRGDSFSRDSILASLDAVLASTTDPEES